MLTSGAEVFDQSAAAFRTDWRLRLHQVGQSQRLVLQPLFHCLQPLLQRPQPLFHGLPFLDSSLPLLAARSSDGCGESIALTAELLCFVLQLPTLLVQLDYGVHVDLQAAVRYVLLHTLHARRMGESAEVQVRTEGEGGEGAEK